MAPRDGVGEEGMAPQSGEALEAQLDWNWIDQLDGTHSLADEELTKLVTMFSGGIQDALQRDNEEGPDGLLGMDPSKLRKLLSLAVRALKSRDADLNEAMEALSSKKGEEELQKKEIRDLKAQVKKLKRARTGQGAMEDLLAVEQDLEQARKENSDLERDLERERRVKEDLESRLDAANNDRQSLRREVEGLRDEISDLKNRLTEGDRDEDRGVVGLGGGAGGGGGGATGMGSGTSIGNRAELEDRLRLRDMEENIRLKNKQIHQLLEDVEQVENESSGYQGKILELKEKLEEATKQINAMAAEFLASKGRADQMGRLVQSLQEDNARLRSSVEEHLQEKKRRNVQLDLIEIEVNKRIEQMRKVLSSKEATIDELRTRLNRMSLMQDSSSAGGIDGLEASIRTSRENISLLTEALRDREDQIKQLQEKMAQASRELESSAKVIEDLTRSGKGQQGGMDPLQRSLIEVRSQLHQAETKVKELQAEKAEAEEAAREKSEELLEALAGMRAYERGEYGLEAAVNDLKAAKKQLKQSDKRVDDLITTCNKLEYHNGELLEENSSLRQKLGISTKRSSASSKDRKSAQSQDKRDDHRALMQVMQREIERLEDDRISLKTENRKLVKQLRGLESPAVRGILDEEDQGSPAVGNFQESVLEKLHEEVSQLRAKNDDLFEENDGLRAGLQEALDSIKDSDGKSDVRIEAPTLEKLLTILDAKHLWGGQYHPALVLKSRIQHLEGSNSELRDLLRKARLDEERLMVSIQKSQLKVQQLQKEISLMKEDIPKSEPEASSDADNLHPAVVHPGQPSSSAGGSAKQWLHHHHGSLFGPSGPEMIAKLNTQLIQVLDQLEDKEREYKELEAELQDQHNKFSIMRHQLGLLYEDHSGQEKIWQDRQDKLRASVRSMEEKLESQGASIKEYEGHFEAWQRSPDPDEIKIKLAESARRLADLKAKEAITARRLKVMEENEKLLRSQCSQLQEDVVTIENSITSKKFVQIRNPVNRFKEMATYKIDALQKALADSVPSSALEEANSLYADLTADYRDLLQKEQVNLAESRRLEELDLALENLRREKQALTSDLESTKEKLLSCQALVDTLQGQLGSSNGEDPGAEDRSGSRHRNQLDALIKQVATLEMRELNEKQKAAHAESRSKLLQSQIDQMQGRLEELESRFSDVTRANLELQRAERDLRDQLVRSLPKPEADALSLRVQELERSSSELGVENTKLREVAEVARAQVELFERKKTAGNVELEALRHEVIDLQSKGDDKVVIGKLHRQLVDLQLKEAELQHAVGDLRAKAAKLEALALKANRKADDMAEAASAVRNQCAVRCRGLANLVQELRRRFSGSVPLARQEKLSKTIRELNEDRRKMSGLLAQAELKRAEAEQRAAELACEQQTAQELLVTLRDHHHQQQPGHQGGRAPLGVPDGGPSSSSSSSVKRILSQLMEWHGKVEEARIKELRARLALERVSGDLDRLRDKCSSQADKIDALEEENLRIEVKLERQELDRRLLDDPEDQGPAAVQLTAAALAEPRGSGKEGSTSGANQKKPDPNWPLSAQLEASLASVQALEKAAAELRSRLAEAKRAANEWRQRCSEAESMLLAKDGIINDLRLQVPATVDRAMVAAGLTGTVPAVDDYESRHVANVAQATVESLRARLDKKDEALVRFEAILRKARSEHRDQAGQLQDEIARLQAALRLTTGPQRGGRDATDGVEPDGAAGAKVVAVVAEKVAAIHKLQDEIQDLQAFLSDTSEQLVSAKSEASQLSRALRQRDAEVRDLRDKLATIANNDPAELQEPSAVGNGPPEKDSAHMIGCQEDQQGLQDEVLELQRQLQASGTAALKLQGELEEKDRKVRAMSKVILDLKNEALLHIPTKISKVKVAAKDGGDAPGPGSRGHQGGKLDVVHDDDDRSSHRLELLQKQVHVMKEREATLLDQMQTLKDQLIKKSAAVARLREAASVAAAEKTPGLVMASAVDREKDELRMTVRSLEKKLEAVNRAEKPLEETARALSKSGAKPPDDHDSTTTMAAPDKERSAASRTAAEELARWDESKRWQRKIEQLKSKLTLAEEESAKLSKANKGLRDMIGRLEREKTVLEGKAAAAGRAAASGSRRAAGSGGGAKEETGLLEAENARLKEELAKSQSDRAMSQGSETLRMRIRFLQERVEAQEKKILALELCKRPPSSAAPAPAAGTAAAAGTGAASGPGSGSGKKVKISAAVAPKAGVDDLNNAPVVPTSTDSGPAKLTRQVAEEVIKLKDMNQRLIAKLEDKSKLVEKLERDLKRAGAASAVKQEPIASAVADHDSGHEVEQRVPSVEEIHLMQQDLKRKSDLLSEVKVLLRQAAERERQMSAELDATKAKVEALLDINPKSPSEQLAKELRLTRLTVDRLECEKRELEHTLQTLSTS